MRSRLSQNTWILLANNLGSAVLALLLSLQLGRGLGDTGFGAYAAIMAWILPLTLLADSGISTFLTRQMAQNPALTRAYLRQALRLRVLIGGSLIIGIWLIGPWLVSPSQLNAFRLATFLILIDNLFGVYTALWRAKEKMLPILGLNMLLLSGQIVGVYAALWANWGLIGVMAAMVGVDIIQLALAAWLWCHYDRPPPASPQPAPSLGKFWQAAFPLAMSSVLVAIQARLLFLLLENLNGQAVLGWFAAASRFLEAAKMPAFALFGALFPVLARRAPKIQFWQIQAGLAGYAIASGLALTLLAKPLLLQTFGAEFAPAAPILMMLAWGLLPLLLRQSQITRLYAQNQEGRVNAILLASLPIQALLGITLIRQYPDGRGAALAFLLTECLLCLWFAWGKLKPDFILAGLIFLVALTLRWNHVDHFDGLYGQDSFAYYSYGLDVKESWANFQAPPPMYWGLGYPSLLAGAFVLFGERPEVAQALNIFLGASVAALTSLLICQMRPKWKTRHRLMAGGLGGLLMAVTGQAILSSVVIMSDIPALFWAMLSLFILRMQSKWGLPLSALLLAMAGLTRWIYILLVIPWGGWAFMHRLARKMLLAASVFGVLLGLQIWHSAQTPAAFRAHEGLNWSVYHLTSQEFNTSEGHFRYPRPTGRFYAESVLSWWHPIFYLLLICGYLGLLYPFQKKAPDFWLLMAWLVVIFVYLGGLHYQNPRFILAFYPPLVILASLGLGKLMQTLDGLKILGWVVNALILLSLLLGLFESYQQSKNEVESLIKRKNTDLAALNWAETQISGKNPRLYTLELWLLVDFYAPHLQAEQIYYETPASLGQQSFENTYLMLNLWALEEQWVGKAPWTAYYWLKEERGLSYLGRYANYYLWRVNS